MDLWELMGSRMSIILDSPTKDCWAGMKVMVMDTETTTSVSLSMPQSAIMKKEVFLFEYIGCHSNTAASAKSGSNLGFLKCIVIVRPSQENIRLLARELQRPRFGHYWLYLTNRISKAQLKSLAESDVHEVVEDIQEIPSDFQVLEAHLFSVGLQQPVLESSLKWAPQAYSRTLESLKSLLLALKVKAVCVGYTSRSNVCQQLATALHSQHMCNLDTSHHSSPDATVIIMDRRMDPVTPLLNQWTYQAMVHELIGIRNNTVDMTGRTSDADAASVLSLGSASDDFYRHNMYANFGEIGQTIQSLVKEFQQTVRGHQQIESIGDIKDFVSNYPEFKKMSGTVNKHVSLMAELSKEVRENGLMEVSECEQTLCCGSDKENGLPKIQGVLEAPTIRTKDALRVIALFTLRHPAVVEKNLDLLCKSVKGMERKAVYDFIQTVTKYSRGVRSSALFEETKLSGNPFSMLTSLRGTENVYTQHRPLLTKEILPDILGQSKSSRSELSFIPDRNTPDQTSSHHKVVIFVVGGFTYEESRAVSVANRKNGCHVVLGGTSLLTFDSYMEEMKKGSLNR